MYMVPFPAGLLLLCSPLRFAEARTAPEKSYSKAVSETPSTWHRTHETPTETGWGYPTHTPDGWGPANAMAKRGIRPISVPPVSSEMPSSAPGWSYPGTGWSSSWPDSSSSWVESSSSSVPVYSSSSWVESSSIPAYSSSSWVESSSASSYSSSSWAESSSWPVSSSYSESSWGATGMSSYSQSSWGATGYPASHVPYPTGWGYSSAKPTGYPTPPPRHKPTGWPKPPSYSQPPYSAPPVESSWPAQPPPPPQSPSKPPCSWATATRTPTSYSTWTPSCDDAEHYCPPATTSSSTWGETTSWEVTPTLTHCSESYVTSSYTVPPTWVDSEWATSHVRSPAWSTGVSTCDIYTVPHSYSWVYSTPTESTYVQESATWTHAAPEYSSTTVWGHTMRPSGPSKLFYSTHWTPIITSYPVTSPPATPSWTAVASTHESEAAWAPASKAESPVYTPQAAWEHDTSMAPPEQWSETPAPPAGTATTTPSAPQEWTETPQPAGWTSSPAPPAPEHWSEKPAAPAWTSTTVPPAPSPPPYVPSEKPSVPMSAPPPPESAPPAPVPPPMPTYEPYSSIAEPVSEAPPAPASTYGPAPAPAPVPAPAPAPVSVVSVGPVASEAYPTPSVVPATSLAIVIEAPWEFAAFVACLAAALFM